jgi:hypothetical protein
MIKEAQPEFGRADLTEIDREAHQDRVRLSDPIWSSFFTLVGLLIFNFYSQIVRFAFASQHMKVLVPPLNSEFTNFLPWINLIWILTLILNSILIGQRRWTPVTRWFDIGLKTGGVVMAYIFISGSPAAAISAQNLLSTRLVNPNSAKVIAKAINTGLDIVIAIIVISGGIEVVRDVYRVLFHHSRTKAQVE